MIISIPKLLAGMILAVVVALAAWGVRSLSRSGALAAALLGTIIFGLGGLTWSILLLAFFVSSSVLSHFFKYRKKSLDEKFSKGSRRDVGQVAANGGIAGLFVVLQVILPSSSTWAWVAFAGALAAANADTWATELGVLSRTRPRLITSGNFVDRGTSGGVTIIGSLASLGGAALIALLAVLFWQGSLIPSHSLPLADAFTIFASITAAGFIGSLIDSFLGATVQSIYFCPNCQKETERFPEHTCGGATHRIRGWSWLDNDWVNIICTMAGSLIALTMVYLFL